MSHACSAMLGMPMALGHVSRMLGGRCSASPGPGHETRMLGYARHAHGSGHVLRMLGYARHAHADTGLHLSTCLPSTCTCLHRLAHASHSHRRHAPGEPSVVAFAPRPEETGSQRVALGLVPRWAEHRHEDTQRGIRVVQARGADRRLGVYVGAAGACCRGGIPQQQ